MEDKSCWTCGFVKLGGVDIILKCSKLDMLITEKKETGEYLVDFGCSMWVKKTIDKKKNN